MGRRALSALIACTLALLAVPLAAQEETYPQQYVGRIVNMNGSPVGHGTTFFTLRIDRLTPDEEVLGLAKILYEKGQSALLSALWDAPQMGFIKIGNSLGYQVPIIRRFRTEDGGTMIRVLTDRPIMFVESMYGLRSKNYPFGLIQITFPPGGGEGEGVLIAAAQASFNADGKLEIKSYGTQPFKILKLKPEKVTGK